MKLRTSIAFAPFAFGAVANAQPFAVDWSTIHPGGEAIGGSFDLFGVIGQHEAGTTLSGGTFEITGGFLAGFANTPHCPADLDNGSGSGTPDGGVTIDDLLFFLGQFELGGIHADLDDGSGTGTPDGGVTIEDLLYFLVHFEGGC